MASDRLQIGISGSYGSMHGEAAILAEATGTQLRAFTVSSLQMNSIRFDRARVLWGVLRCSEPLDNANALLGQPTHRPLTSRQRPAGCGLSRQLAAAHPLERVPTPSYTATCYDHEIATSLPSQSHGPPDLWRMSPKSLARERLGNIHGNQRQQQSI